MDKKPFVPPIPHIEPPDEKTLEKMKTTDRSKNSKVKKAHKEFLSKENKRKKLARIEWYKSHWIDLTALAISFLSLIVAIIAIVITL